MKTSKILIGIVVVAIIAVAISYIYPKKVANVIAGATGTSNFSALSTASIAVGSGCDSEFGTCTGTTVKQLEMGQCYLDVYKSTIAASSTIPVDCQATPNISYAAIAPLTGVVFGDNVQVELSTTTAGTGTNGGLSLTGESASTTAGYITMMITNVSGTTYTWPTTGIASGTASYLASH